MHRYQVCAFCHQRLHLENNNQCPGCRTTYGSQTAETFKPPSSASIVALPAKEKEREAARPEVERQQVASGKAYALHLSAVVQLLQGRECFLQYLN